MRGRGVHNCVCACKEFLGFFPVSTSVGHNSFFFFEWTLLCYPFYCHKTYANINKTQKNGLTIGVYRVTIFHHKKQHVRKDPNRLCNTLLQRFNLICHTTQPCILWHVFPTVIGFQSMSPCEFICFGNFFPIMLKDILSSSWVTLWPDTTGVLCINLVIRVTTTLI